MSHKQSSSYVQSSQSPSVTVSQAGTLTKTKELAHYPDANTTSTSGFTIHAVPTTSISDNKPSLKSPYSHTQLPSVTSILLLNTKKKVHSQGN